LVGWLFSHRFVDALGHCCDTQLDAQGLCCSSAIGLDACGVCGGSGLTCAWEVTIIARGSDVRFWPDSMDVRDSEEHELEEWDPNRLEMVKRWNKWLSRALKMPDSSRVRLISANESVVLHNESALCQKKKRMLCETERSENVPFCDLKESTLCSESEAISPVPYLVQHLDAGLLHTFCDENTEQHCGEDLGSTDGMQTFTFKIQPQDSPEPLEVDRENTFHPSLSEALTPQEIRYRLTDEIRRMRSAYGERPDAFRSQNELWILAFSNVAASSSRVFNTCGNGVCDIGERCDERHVQDAQLTRGLNMSLTCCPTDCPFVHYECPKVKVGGRQQHNDDGREQFVYCSGHGKCHPSSGSCECNSASGYTGDNCGQCAKGWRPQVGFRPQQELPICELIVPVRYPDVSNPWSSCGVGEEESVACGCSSRKNVMFDIVQGGDFVRIYVCGTAGALPVHDPSELQFWDHDDDLLEIAGEIRFTRAKTEWDITHYRLYFGRYDWDALDLTFKTLWNIGNGTDNSTSPDIGSSLPYLHPGYFPLKHNGFVPLLFIGEFVEADFVAIPTGDINFTLYYSNVGTFHFNDSTVPGNATHLLLYACNADGQIEQPLGIEIVDKVGVLIDWPFLGAVFGGLVGIIIVGGTHFWFFRSICGALIFLVLLKYIFCIDRPAASPWLSKH
jgi:hypothetical protein